MQVLIFIFGTPPSCVEEKYGNFADFFSAKHNLPDTPIINFKTINIGELAGFSQVDLADIKGAVLSGSAAMIDENPPWLNDALLAIKRLMNADIPILGVCFGHQLLALAEGGEVGVNPKGRSMGSRRVELFDRDDVLFKNLSREFFVHVSHRDALLRPSPTIKIIGQSDHDSHHVFRIGKHFWGVQFHPEWTSDITKGYCEARLMATKKQESLDSIQRSTIGPSLMRAFYSYCKNRF